ncbi:hypothetical protein CARUB_v10021803mg [Capsella rubella]|uniref:Terpene synthase metal-binding domain-containing protein n=1 Tax=Capsella rubella TaxID=81985 RepID=R0ICB5_9BRAS|nr:hypothetical protein CARUB_v10021803mg [Capsella rubella]
MDTNKCITSVVGLLLVLMRETMELNGRGARSWLKMKKRSWLKMKKREDGDVFKRFQRKDGTFKECLVVDAKGMLSLYEAAHLETQTEKILEEALRFTPGQLNLPPHISRLIKISLYIPQRYNNKTIFAKRYISFYEQEEDHDKMLLQWWKEQDLAAKLPPYFRDRMVECYFFTFEVQPQFSHERVLAAKFFMLYTIVDETCDRFAFFPETKILVECMERLVPDSVDSLPDYMKPIFKFTLNVFEEPELVRAIARNTRLLNDMTGCEDDMNRGDEANVNEEFLKIAKKMPIHILHRAINCGSMSIITYRDGDGYTNPIGRFKHHMTSLFVDLMPL